MADVIDHQGATSRYVCVLSSSYPIWLCLIFFVKMFYFCDD